MTDNIILKVDIEIEDDTNNWHDATIHITVFEWMDDNDILAAVTEKATEYCNRNGLNYETWEYV